MNLGESTSFFRETFRGFNKDDVAEYIAKLSKDYIANEEKYKEHIAKLTAELKSKTDNISAAADYENLANEAAQKYKAEITGLNKELGAKDETIEALRAQLASSAEPADCDSREEIEKYKEAMNGMAKEIEEFKAKCEALADEASNLRGAGPGLDKDAVNQLSLQLAANESERLYLFNLLKKFIFALDIESARGKDAGNMASISDIAPKAAVAGEIESGLGALIKFKESAAGLEAENAALREELDKKQAALSDEEQMYRSIMTKLGDTVYSANKSAEDSVAKAKNEAVAIIDSAKAEANEIIDKANAKREAIAEQDRRNTLEIREKYEFIKKEHESMYQKYKDISESYELKLLEIESTINVVYDSVSDA